MTNKIHGMYWLAFNYDMAEIINIVKSYQYSTELSSLGEYFYVNYRSRTSIPYSAQQVLDFISNLIDD